MKEALAAAFKFLQAETSKASAGSSLLGQRIKTNRAARHGAGRPYCC
jgi:hypothetical protein